MGEGRESQRDRDRETEGDRDREAEGQRHRDRGGRWVANPIVEENDPQKPH